MLPLGMKIKEILKGIDQTDMDSAVGWWETSTGAEYGQFVLGRIMEVLDEYGVKDYKGVF